MEKDNMFTNYDLPEDIFEKYKHFILGDQKLNKTTFNAMWTDIKILIESEDLESVRSLSEWLFSLQSCASELMVSDDYEAVHHYLGELKIAKDIEESQKLASAIGKLIG